MDTVIFMGIVLGLVEVIKRALGLNSRFVPIVALLMSFALLGIYSIGSGVPFDWGLIETGFIVGLGSVGLYSGVKNTVQ
jgi:hypothetical protein